MFFFPTPCRHPSTLTGRSWPGRILAFAAIGVLPSFLNFVGPGRIVQRSSRVQRQATDLQVEYSESSTLDGRPVSVWSPGTPRKSLDVYNLKLSNRKLSQSLIGFPLGRGPEVVEVPASNIVGLASKSSVQSQRGVILVHGLLGTRFDMAFLAEELASRGFVVMAPEMEDSWSNVDGIIPGGFVGAVVLGREGVEARRRSVVQQAIEILQSRGVSKVGLVGHSRGGVTVSQMQGTFCRVNMAGFLPPPVEPRANFHESASNDRVLVICGEDDEVCCRGPLSLQICQERVKALVPNADAWYPAGIGHLTLIDTRILKQMRLKVAPLPLPLGEPATDGFAAELLERVTSFLDKHV